MIKREIRDKRNKLREESIRLRENAPLVKFNKTQSMRKEQNEIYKKWEFYDKLIKAYEK
jgi:hypothetical protein